MFKGRPMYQGETNPVVKALYALWIVNWLLIAGFCISTWVAVSSGGVGSAGAFVLIWITLMFIVTYLWSILYMHDADWRTGFYTGAFWAANIFLFCIALMEVVYAASLANTWGLSSGPFVAVAVFTGLLTATILMFAINLYAAHPQFVNERHTAGLKTAKVGEYTGDVRTTHPMGTPVVGAV